MSGPTLNFTKERLDRGLSQAAIAAEIGIATSVWGRLENGNSVSPANALKVATFFGRTVTDIWPIDPEAAAA